MKVRKNNLKSRQSNYLLDRINLRQLKRSRVMRIASLSEAPEGKAIIGLVGRGEGTVMDPTNYDFGDQHEMLKAATTITMVI